MSKHITLAGSSGICLIYCDCFSKTQNKKMTIVAALTDGNIDNLAIGRNAIFYDRNGDDWDATIIKIIDNPISIRQAFWSPYRKVSKFISTQIDKVASAKEKEVDTVTASHVEKTSSSTQTVHTDKVPAPVAAQPPFDIGKFVGIFAAISLALGAIGSVVASILTGFFGLAWWKMPLAIVGIILSISGPSMIIAWLKLRKRNLAPLLDANGWAINARATINIPFGNTLTHLASLPENSKLNLIDPFSNKKRPFLKSIIVFVILLIATLLLMWRFGYFNPRIYIHYKKTFKTSVQIITGEGKVFNLEKDSTGKVAVKDSVFKLMVGSKVTDTLDVHVALFKHYHLIVNKDSTLSCTELPAKK